MLCNLYRSLHLGTITEMYLENLYFTVYQSFNQAPPSCDLGLNHSHYVDPEGTSTN